LENQIQTLVKGLNVLESFENDSDEKGIQDVSNIIDLPESTIHRILNTLEYKGYVIQNLETKKYRLTLKFLRIAGKITNMIQWKERAKIWMIELNKKCNETVNLTIREGDKPVYIDKVGSTQVLRPNFAIGTLYPTYCTALGKVLLMDLPEETLNSG